MEVYEYSFNRWYGIKVCAVEVEETKATYRAKFGFPYSYKTTYKKSEIGKIGHYGRCLCLEERNDKLAKGIFEEYINNEIQELQKEIDTNRHLINLIHTKKIVEEIEERE